MTDTPKEIQEEVPPELAKIVSRFERFSITPAPRPPKSSFRNGALGLSYNHP